MSSSISPSLAFYPIKRLNLIGQVLYFERLTLKTLIETRTSEVFWNKVAAIGWGMVFIAHTIGGYRAGNNFDMFHIAGITFSSMIFMMYIYDWYISIQRLKFLTECIKDIENFYDNYFKDFSRD